MCVSAGLSIVAEQESSLLETDTVWAYLPSDFTGGPDANPEWSLSSAIPNYQGRDDAGEAVKMLSQLILGYLQDGPDRYMVFQDVNLSPDSSWLLEWQHYFTFGTEVYHFLSSTNTNHDTDHIIDVMRMGYTANSRLNAGILTTTHNIPEIMPRQEITIDVKRALSNGTEHIIVDGFDGDREIIWSKDKRSMEQR